MEPQAKEFLLAEYKGLRDEILDAVKEVPRNERLALIVSGVFWSWFATQAFTAPYICLISWLPLALTWLLFLRAKTFDAKFVRFHEYLMKVEDALLQDGGGWEHFLASRTPWPDSERPLWRFLIVGNICLFVVTIAIYSLRSHWLLDTFR